VRRAKKTDVEQIEKKCGERDKGKESFLLNFS
jgi:hypothetical protein